MICLVTTRPRVRELLGRDTFSPSQILEVDHKYDQCWHYQFFFYQKLFLYLKGIITLSITLINLIRTTSLFRILTANLPDMFLLVPLHRGIHRPLVEGSPSSKDLPQNPVLKLSSLSRLALPWPWSTLHRAVATPFDNTFIIISTTTSTNRGANAFQAFNNKIQPKSHGGSSSPSSPEISQKARLQCTSRAAAQQVILSLLSS